MDMKTKDVIYKLRTEAKLSQDELAERVFVTRQAVSRWENGDTVPNTDTLMLLSRLFDVSINTLLGSPRQLICQCCGMPIEEDGVSRERNGFLNEEYCKWCYADGEFTYDTMDELINGCLRDEEESPEQLRVYLQQRLSQLNHWKRYTQLGGEGMFDAFKQQLVEEINALHIEGMPQVDSLNALVGEYVNLTYRLPNGRAVRFLDDSVTYLGTQLPCLFDESVCFGVVANMEFILVCTYEENGENPELILYKKR